MTLDRFLAARPQLIANRIISLEHDPNRYKWGWKFKIRSEENHYKKHGFEARTFKIDN